MKVINPGEFRHRIEVQRYKGIEKNEDNIPVEKWETLFTPKAKILNVRGQEFIQAYGSDVKISKTFWIRARRNIEVTESDRVKYKDKIYKIHYANDLEDRGIYLELKCEGIE